MEHTLNTIEGVWAKGGSLVGNQEQADPSSVQSSNRNNVCCASERELPVVTNNGVPSDTGPEGNGLGAATVSERRTLGRIEFLLTGACVATKGT